MYVSIEHTRRRARTRAYIERFKSTETLGYIRNIAFDDSDALPRKAFDARSSFARIVPWCLQLLCLVTAFAFAKSDLKF